MNERQKLAANELRQLHKTVRSVRFFFVGSALFIGVFTFLTAPLAPLPTLVVMTTMLLVSIVGAIQVPFHPLVWGLVFAIALSAGELMWFLAMPTPINFVWLVQTAIGLFLVVCAWAVVPNLRRLNRLLEDHPDLYEAHRIRGTELARLGRFRGEDLSAAEQRAVLKRALGRAWGFSAGAAVLVLLGVVSLAYPARVGGLRADDDVTEEDVPAQPPPPIDDDLARFARAWDRADPAHVADFFPLGERPAAQARVASAAQRNGWADGFPAIEDWDVTAIDATHLQADGALAGGGRLVTRWSVNDVGAWELTTLVPPRP